MKTYQVEGINRIFWKLSKEENLDFTGSWEQLYDRLNFEVQNYTSNVNFNLTEREIVFLAIDSYCEFVASGLANKYNTKLVFETIYGDRVLESIFGEDTRPLSCKIIVGILLAYRNTQIRIKQGDEYITLIDYNSL